MHFQTRRNGFYRPGGSVDSLIREWKWIGRYAKDETNGGGPVKGLRGRRKRASGIGHLGVTRGRQLISDKQKNRSDVTAGAKGLSSIWGCWSLSPSLSLSQDGGLRCSAGRAKRGTRGWRERRGGGIRLASCLAFHPTSRLVETHARPTSDVRCI